MTKFTPMGATLPHTNQITKLGYLYAASHVTDFSRPHFKLFPLTTVWFLAAGLFSDNFKKLSYRRRVM